MDEKNQGRKFFTGIVDFIKEKPLVFTGIIVVVLVAAGGIYAIASISQQTAEEEKPMYNAALSGSDSSGSASDVAEILPQQRRDNNLNQSSANSNQSVPNIDPFADPMNLTGIVTGGYGGSMAIVVSGGTSYIVSVGDYIDDLWAVYEISPERVVVRAYSQEVTLYLDQPPETRSLDVQQEQDMSDQEEGA